MAVAESRHLATMGHVLRLPAFVTNASGLQMFAAKL
jgi:hypothetical protein